MDNPWKLAIYGTQNKEKQDKEKQSRETKNFPRQMAREI
jgi:hypothetical protein